MKNIYDSYHFEQMVLVPPDERNIEELELALHEPLTVEYFYNYLKDLNDESQSKKNVKQVNYYRMLSLYMDIRCFDEDIRKFKKFNSIHTVAQSERQSGVGTK